MRLENLTTAHEDADAIYKTDISDARWIAYDIPGNIGWMTYLAVLAKMIKDRKYGSAAVSAAPAVLMIAGVAELISERIEGLDRDLPKKRLYRGFGALTLGGITGVASAVVANTEYLKYYIMSKTNNDFSSIIDAENYLTRHSNYLIGISYAHEQRRI